MIEPMRDDLMVQQQLPASDLKTRQWQHMVAVICLNRTTRRAVKYVLPLFFSKWPSPAEFLWVTDEQAREILWPLGMFQIRFKRLKFMTGDFMHWNGVDAKQLYGIGKYGSDSFEIFFNNNYTVTPTDKELKRYLKEEVNVFETA